MKTMSRWLSRMIDSKGRGGVLKVTIEGFRPVNHPARETPFELRKNRLEDFLLLKEAGPKKLRLLVQQAVERIGQDHNLHTAMINGVLAYYGWSSHIQPVVSGGNFRLPPGGVFLYDIYAADEHQSEQQLFLSLILKEAFASDTHAAYIIAPRSSVVLGFLQELGFTRCDPAERESV
jgi:hypothetical protein